MADRLKGEGWRAAVIRFIAELRRSATSILVKQDFMCSGECCRKPIRDCEELGCVRQRDSREAIGALAAAAEDSLNAESGLLHRAMVRAVAPATCGEHGRRARNQRDKVEREQQNDLRDGGRTSHLYSA